VSGGGGGPVQGRTAPRVRAATAAASPRRRDWLWGGHSAPPSINQGLATPVVPPAESAAAPPDRGRPPLQGRLSHRLPRHSRVLGPTLPPPRPGNPSSTAIAPRSTLFPPPSMPSRVRGGMAPPSCSPRPRRSAALPRSPTLRQHVQRRQPTGATSVPSPSCLPARRRGRRRRPRRPRGGAPPQSRRERRRHQRWRPRRARRRRGRAAPVPAPPLAPPPRSPPVFDSAEPPRR